MRSRNMEGAAPKASSLDRAVCLWGGTSGAVPTCDRKPEPLGCCRGVWKLGEKAVTLEVLSCRLPLLLAGSSGSGVPPPFPVRPQGPEGSSGMCQESLLL